MTTFAFSFLIRTSLLMGLTVALQGSSTYQTKQLSSAEQELVSESRKAVIGTGL